MLASAGKRLWPSSVFSVPGIDCWFILGTSEPSTWPCAQHTHRTTPIPLPLSGHPVSARRGLLLHGAGGSVACAGPGAAPRLPRLLRLARLPGKRCSARCIARTFGPLAWMWALVSLPALNGHQASKKHALHCLDAGLDARLVVMPWPVSPSPRSCINHHMLISSSHWLQEAVKRVVKVCRDKGVTPGGQHSARRAAQRSYHDDISRTCCASLRAGRSLLARMSLT